jgi:uncharacterized membrane protein YjjP (DUF1212 family)
MKTDEKIFTLRVALYAGEILLKNGAETYRVEDTITIICRSRNYRHISPYCTLTGIFVSDDRSDGLSFLKRIKERTINLDKIAQVNDFAREFANSDMSLGDALHRLKEIDQAPRYKESTVTFFASLGAAFFALLFGGGLPDFLVAFFITLIAVYLSQWVNNFSDTPFLGNILAGAVIALFALISKNLGFVTTIDMVVSGSIMPFVPGVALTNGLRDFISGDFIAGTTRVGEALMIAVSVAVGVGSIIEFWRYLYGGLI